MKLGSFIAIAIALSTSAHADTTSTITKHREAYALDGDASHLVHIGHAYKAAGNRRAALGEFCRYLYVDSAGALAGEAFENVLALSAQLGNPTQSEREACSTRSSASRPTPLPSVGTLGTAIVRPPRITKREIVGFVGLGSSIASLGLGLLQAQKLKDIRADMATDVPPPTLDALTERERSTSLRVKLLLGAGGVTLITGGILYVTGRNDRKRAERAYLTPSVTKGGGGLVLGGRF